MTGRPSKLTSELAKKILESLRDGIGRNATIEAAGVGRTTFYRWLELGARARSGKYRDFRNRIRKAEADAEIRNVVAVQKVAMGGELVSKITVHKPDGTVIERQRFSPPDFRAATWWLTRRYPEQWGRRTSIEHRTKRPDQSELIWIQDVMNREMAAGHAL